MLVQDSLPLRIQWIWQCDSLMQCHVRHACLDPTGLYLHAEEKEWHETMDRHRLKE